MQLQQIKDIFHSELDSLYTKDEVNHFFYRLIEHYLGLERFVLVLDPTITVSKTEEQPLFEGLAALKQEKPIQYILGVEYFMDLAFKVNKSVLIPRPETEELVGWVLEDHKEEKTGLSILDIGTGSGCIAIAIGKNLPKTKITAIDISEKALAVAKLNSEELRVPVKFLRKDISTNLELDQKFDVIVSNPPYVKISEKNKMRNNVKKYEPKEALFVRDEDPLFFYKHIAAFSSKNLREGGKLYLEINQHLAQETIELLNAYNFSEIEVRKDIFENERMLKAIWLAKT